MCGRPRTSPSPESGSWSRAPCGWRTARCCAGPGASELVPSKGSGRTHGFTSPPLLRFLPDGGTSAGMIQVSMKFQEDCGHDDRTGSLRSRFSQARSEPPRFLPAVGTGHRAAGWAVPKPSTGEFRRIQALRRRKRPGSVVGLPARWRRPVPTAEGGGGTSMRGRGQRCDDSPWSGVGPVAQRPDDLPRVLVALAAGQFTHRIDQSVRSVLLRQGLQE